MAVVDILLLMAFIVCLRRHRFGLRQNQHMLDIILGPSTFLTSSQKRRKTGKVYVTKEEVNDGFLVEDIMRFPVDPTTGERLNIMYADFDADGVQYTPTRKAWPCNDLMTERQRIYQIMAISRSDTMPRRLLQQK
eukprot:82961_1